jgi:hypothetical protein
VQADPAGGAGDQSGGAHAPDDPTAAPRRTRSGATPDARSSARSRDRSPRLGHPITRRDRCRRWRAHARRSLRGLLRPAGLHPG